MTRGVNKKSNKIVYLSKKYPAGAGWMRMGSVAGRVSVRRVHVMPAGAAERPEPGRQPAQDGKARGGGLRFLLRGKAQFGADSSVTP